MLPSSYDGQDCSLARALEIVGERWTLLVLRDAFYGVRRFNDFLAHLDMPRTVLSNRLRSLIESGVLALRADRRRDGVVAGVVCAALVGGTAIRSAAEGVHPRCVWHTAGSHGA